MKLSASYAATFVAFAATVLFFGADMTYAQTDDTPANGSSIYCPNLTQTLKRGMRDVNTTPTGQITELQNFLADYFDLSEDVILSGYFGRLSQRYVMQFQRENNLPAFGIVGSLTRAKIAEACTRPETSIKPCLNVPEATCMPGYVTYNSMPDAKGCFMRSECVRATTPPTSCSILPPQTQTISCPNGQLGNIVQSRVSTCPAGASQPMWGDWQTTSSTCGTQTNCVAQPSQTQVISCPSGQTGQITQTRTSACLSGATVPTWSDWQNTANTCAPISSSPVSLTSYPNFNNLCYAFVTGYANGTNVISNYADTCTEQAKSAPLLFSVSQEVSGGHTGAANNSPGRTLYMNDYDYASDYNQWIKANFYPTTDGMVYGAALDTANYKKTNVTGWPIQKGNLFFGLNDISTDHANIHLDKDIFIEFDFRLRGDDINNDMNPGTYSGHRIMLGTLLDWPEQGGRTNTAHFFEVNLKQSQGYAQIYGDPDLPLCHDFAYDRCAYDISGTWSENRYVPYRAVSGGDLTLNMDQWVHVKIPLSFAKSLGWVSKPSSWANAKFSGLYIAMESTGATRYWIEVKNYKVYAQ